MKSLIDLLVRLFSKPARIEPEPVVTNDVAPPVAANKSSITKTGAIGGVASATVIAAATVFIAQWEGLRTTAYDDGGGVWTICYGHTKGVKQGDTATKQQCELWLKEDIEEHSIGMRKCVTTEFKQNEEVAHLSLTFNIGVANYCGSSALRLHNAGDPNAGCELMKLWKKDNGIVIPGLVNRRAAEATLCKKG